MSGLLARLKAGRAAVGQVTVDGVTFGLRLLTEQDYLAAQIATEAAMREAGMELSVSTAEAFEAEKSSQLLVRALIDPANSQPVAETAQELRDMLPDLSYRNLPPTHTLAQLPRATPDLYAAQLDNAQTHWDSRLVTQYAGIASLVDTFNGYSLLCDS